MAFGALAACAALVAQSLVAPLCCAASHNNGCGAALQTHHRHAHVQCGAAADLIKSRTGCSDEEAQRAEGRLGGRSVNPLRCKEVYDGLQRRLDLSDAEMKRIVLNRPAVLGLDFEGRLVPALDSIQRRIGLNKAELKRVVLRLPTLLGYSFNTNVEPKIDALQCRLRLNEAELRKVVVAQPSILGLNYEKNLAPKLDFFQDKLAISPDTLRQRVVQMPAILTYSLAARYQPRLERCLAASAPTELVFDRITYPDAKFNASVPIDPIAWHFTRARTPQAR